MYDLLEVYVQEPSVSPDKGTIIYARPYEFEGDKATKYTATSPHCGRGMTFGPHDTLPKFGFRFIQCPCMPPLPIVQFEDPFINPIAAGVMDSGIQRPKMAIPAVLKAAKTSVCENDVDDLVREILGL